MRGGSGGQLPMAWFRLPEKGNSNSHGARTVHLIITMIKWIRTKRTLSVRRRRSGSCRGSGSAKREQLKRCQGLLPGSQP